MAAQLFDNFVMPIGIHKGKALKDIPLADLDALVGWLEEKDLVKRFAELYAGLVEYLKANGYEPGDY